MNDIEGHYISGYADGGDQPDKVLQLVPGAVNEAEEFLQSHPQTQERFDRVAELVAGFESPFGLELLATTHWVIKQESAKTPEAITEKIYQWSSRKRQFTPRQISLAAQVVAEI